MSDELIIQLVREHFDLRPYGITRMLNLIQPMYKQTAVMVTLVEVFRHRIYMGKTDKVDVLKDASWTVTSYLILKILLIMKLFYALLTLCPKIYIGNYIILILYSIC